ncbi:MAG: TIGR04279 domain-containing protein [ANME-2 cluster archaeon]|nr:TIGR04279 domain-containing protein [ANME-2 cluster archaeon]
MFNISINSSENVTFANHNDSKIEGNWIDLSGGTPITLPTLNFIYYGINNSTFTINGKTVNITTSVDSNTDYSILYPYSSHSLYTNVTGSNVVNMSFYGSSYFANKGIDIYFVSSTPEGIWDIFNDAMDGNTTPFRDLLNESDKLLNYSLNETGDNSSISFNPEQAGDYVVLVILNSSYLTNEDDLSVLSTTVVQILKYESVVTAPAEAETNSVVNVMINLTNAGSLVNYTYGAVLVHKDAYNATLRFNFNGTRNQTNLTIDGEYLIENGELSGINLSSLNTTRLTNIITTVMGLNNGTLLIKEDVNSNNTSILLDTEDLNTGDYYLLVGAFESNDRLVAFNQSVVNIYTPETPTSAPSGGGSGGGGGGGGGTSGEEFENIICTEVDRQFVGSDQEVSFYFEFDCNYVKYINLTGVASSGKIAAKVETLNHTSSLVDIPAPDIVFKNLNVWAGNMGWFSETNVKDPTIMFMVDRSWVNNNGIILNTISFYSYNDVTNNWEKRSTQKISEDSNSYYFKASLPIRGNLGPMAISGRSTSAPVHPSPTIKPTITPQPTPEIVPTPVIWTGIWKEKVPGFQVLTALFVLIALYISRKRRN